MASSTKNVKLGVCRAYLGGVDLGLTKGGVEVQVSTETYEVEVDQYGSTPIKEQIMGRAVSATVPMAEATIENIAAQMPGASLRTDGVRASATVSFASNPTAANSVTIGGVAIAFSANPTAKTDCRIGTTLDETIENFISLVNRLHIGKLQGGVVAELGSAPNIVRIRAIEFGTGPNAITLAATGPTASGATLAGGVAQTKAYLEVSTGTGIDLLDIAKELRLHPISLAEDDFSEDFVIFRAATPGALQFAYQLESERIFNAEFKGYPHPVSGKLFAIGNPNA